MTQFILKNNVVIEMSTRKSNRSGYTGAAFSPAWTLDESRPFIAACSNPSDEKIMSQLRAQERTAWHGGSYADAREAAYVVALFKNDPVTIDDYIRDNGVWDDFPSDLYDLPVVMSLSDAQKTISLIKSTHKPVKKSRITKVTLNNEEARKVFWAKYDKNKQDEMFDKYGKATVVNDMIKLTWNEFDLRYGMDA